MPKHLSPIRRPREMTGGVVNCVVACFWCRFGEHTAAKAVSATRREVQGRAGLGDKPHW